MITYELKENLYINLTNKCSNKCSFCVRSYNAQKQKLLFDGVDLWLNREPTAEEVIKDLVEKDYRKYESIVFCGFGEPMIKLDEVLEIAKYIKENSDLEIRINTNGQANLIHKRNVVPELVGLVDSVSISLNAENALKYQDICQSDFGEAAYGAVLDFAKKCSDSGIKTVFTAVEGLVNGDECEKIAKDNGAEFRIRPKL